MKVEVEEIQLTEDGEERYSYGYEGRLVRLARLEEKLEGTRQRISRNQLGRDAWSVVEALAVEQEGRLKVGKLHVDQNPRIAGRYTLAPLRDPWAPVVFIATGANEFVVRPVVLGQGQGDLYEVVRGLEAGEEIVYRVA